MAQFLRPDSNITQTSFTGGFADIDETFANLNDNDFAYGANNTAATLECHLSNPTGTPQSGTCSVRWRYAKTNAGAVDSGGNTVDVTGAIYQGTTLVATDTAKSALGVWQTALFTFNTSAVTDWNDLRFRFTTTASGGGPTARRGGGVSWAELEIPDPATGGVTASGAVGTVTTTAPEPSVAASASVSAGISTVTVSPISGKAPWDQYLAPDGIQEQANISGAIWDIQDDPYNPDAFWHEY